MRLAQIMTWKSGLSEELRSEWIKKRAGWTVPDGITVLAEFLIPAGGNKLVVIYEGEDLGTLIRMRAPWMKYFDIDVYPTVSMEDLLKATPEILEALG